jgi:hypothetical protein
MRAMERFGSLTESRDGSSWLDTAVYTAVHACLVRSALLDLPALLEVSGKDLMPGMHDILRKSYADRVDGDTYVGWIRWQPGLYL